MTEQKQVERLTDELKEIQDKWTTGKVPPCERQQLRRDIAERVLEDALKEEK